MQKDTNKSKRLTTLGGWGSSLEKDAMESFKQMALEGGKGRVLAPENKRSKNKNKIKDKYWSSAGWYIAGWPS